MTTTAPERVRVEGLSVTRSGRCLLHPTSLELRAGERVGVVGASGSGKSTLALALVDALKRQGIAVGYVPQSPDEALDPLRSVGFQWREALRALDAPMPPTTRCDLFTALAIDTGDLSSRPWGWSRGMQQRFVIAMALAGAPAILVMDEPTSALDPIVAARTMTLLERTLAARRTGLVLVSHDLGLVAQRVQRVLVLDEGRVVEDAATATLLARPQSAPARALCAHRYWDNWYTAPC